MGIEAVKFRTDGFYSQPFAFGDEQISTKTSATEAVCRIISSIPATK